MLKVADRGRGVKICQNLVCKIPLLARALGLKAKRARDDRVSCIQAKILLTSYVNAP